MASEEKIAFSIRGDAVNEDFRFDQFNEIVSAYQQILDRSFLAAMGRRRMRKEEREMFHAHMRQWRRGLIVIDLAVVAVPFIQGYMEMRGSLPHFLTISEVVELTYKFLKARVEYFLTTGRSPHVEIINSPNAQVILNIGDGKITVSQNLVDAANMTEPYYRTLTSHIDGKNITGISSISENKRGILLGVDDNALFNPATEVEDSPKRISAKIFRFDVESASGKLRIHSAQDLENGVELRFEIVGNQPIDAYVDALHSNVRHSNLQVLQEIVRHPSGTESVAALHVTKVLGSEFLK